MHGTGVKVFNFSLHFFYFLLLIFHIQCHNAYINFFMYIYVRILKRMILRNLISLSMNKCLDNLNISANFSHEQQALNIITHCFICRSKWPSCLRLWCAAARLLGLRFRVLPWWMDVCLL